MGLPAFLLGVFWAQGGLALASSPAQLGRLLGACEVGGLGLVPAGTACGTVIRAAPHPATGRALLWAQGLESLGEAARGVGPDAAPRQASVGWTDTARPDGLLLKAFMLEPL